jgi:formyltetrahydrofolate-dependent phosphoribosylglycinamide formyltransferase
MAATSPPRLAILLSGSGRTLLNIHDHILSGDLPAEIALVIASRPCAGAERAAECGLQVRVIQGDIPLEALTHLFHEHAIDWVVLAGYLRKLPIAAGFEGRVVNIHPALLPRYGGPGMYAERVHAAVLASGDAESGCTVHLAGADYDTGPIILQKRCPVLPGDTPATLAARVFELETQAYPEALKLLIARSVP